MNGRPRGLPTRSLLCLLLLWGTEGVALRAAAPRPPEIAARTLLPAPAGWALRGNAGNYTPDDLYEYIDGAAENFLAYGFQELAVATYEKQGGEVTVEVYRHSDDDAAFGIYASERPRGGEIQTIGAEGYCETGLLNFLTGPFYVKITAFGLPAAQERAVLQTFAAATAALGPAEPALPPLLATLPGQGQLPRSARYLRQNPFGYDCLPPVFVADYSRDGRSYRCFLLTAPATTTPAGIAARWRQAAGLAEGEGLVTSWTDPHLGKVVTRAVGRYLTGVLGDCPDPRPLLDAMAGALPGDR